MKKLILLRGLPGSGKSTVAELLKDQIGDEKCITYAADEFFMDVNREYNFDRNKLGAAHMWCRTQVTERMLENFPIIIVHNTFTTNKEVNEYMDVAEKYSYDVICLIVENRHGSSNMHNVPEEVLGKMEERFNVKLI